MAGMRRSASRVAFQMARSVYALCSIGFFFLHVATIHIGASVLPVSGLTDQYRQKYCRDLHQRHEWRTLSADEKSDYIKAVLCLQALPARYPVYKEIETRFDEFQAYHIQQSDYVHLVGQFLPWHRHFIQQYENALRSECGYKGYSPYWDWTQDSESGNSLDKAPVFDPLTGFGGDGVPGTYTLPPNIPPNEHVFPEKFRGCVQDGPFANLVLRLGPGKQRTTHCLTRGIGVGDSIYLNSTAIANATKSATFETFRVQLEGAPVTKGHRMHDGGHLSIGGEMSNFYSSPGEPLFYLHHANLDRIWWSWQQMVPSRIYEISGRSTTDPPYINVTLDHPLRMSRALGRTVPLWKVLNIHSEHNCYTYV